MIRGIALIRVHFQGMRGADLVFVLADLHNLSLKYTFLDGDAIFPDALVAGV